MKTEIELTPLETLLKEGRGKYDGNSNYGKPKSDYLSKLIAMTDDELYEACKSDIWLSAYASNNHRSDYHWMCDATYDEAHRRGKGEIYSRAHKSVSSNC